MGQHFSQAAEFFDANRPELAERLVRRDLEADPNDARALALLALCQSRRNRGAEALRTAQEAVGRDPELAFAHYTSALVHLGTGRFRLRRARRAIERALALDPTNAEHLFLLAAIRLDQGAAAEALELTERGLRLHPRNPRCLSVRAMALTHLGRAREAGEHTASALASDPGGSYAHRMAAQARLWVGDLPAGERHLTEALRLAPTTTGVARQLRGVRRVLRLLRPQLRLALRLGLLRRPRAPGRPARPGWLLGAVVLGALSQSVSWATGNPALRIAYPAVLGFALIWALAARLSDTRGGKVVAVLVMALVWIPLATAAMIGLTVLLGGPETRPGADPAGSLTLLGAALCPPLAVAGWLGFLVVVCPRIGDQVAGAIPAPGAVLAAAGIDDGPPQT